MIQSRLIVSRVRLAPNAVEETWCKLLIRTGAGGRLKLCLLQSFFLFQKATAVMAQTAKPSILAEKITATFCVGAASKTSAPRFSQLIA
jgi:hypothetical protein